MSNGSGLFSNQGPKKPHLVTGHGGVPGEVDDLRGDVHRVLAPMAALSVDEYTNPAAGAAGDLEAATATTVAPRTVTTFLAGGLAKLAAYPRNLAFTTGGVTPGNAPDTVTVTGTYRGKPQTETIALSQAAGQDVGTKPFSTVESVAYGAALDVDATVSIDIGAGLGTSEIPVSRAGLVAPVREIAIGAAVTTGTLTAEGLYTPAAAPNGTNDYAIYYEYNPLV